MLIQVNPTFVLSRRNGLDTVARNTGKTKNLNYYKLVISYPVSMREKNTNSPLQLSKGNELGYYYGRTKLNLQVSFNISTSSQIN